MQNQRGQTFLALAAQKNFPHIPHFQGKGILLSHARNHIMIGQNAYISMVLTQCIQSFLPDSLQPGSICQNTCRLQLHRPQIGIADIISTGKIYGVFKGCKPVFHTPFCSLQIRVMFQKLHQIYHQKSNLRLKSMIGRRRIHQNSQLIAVALRLIYLRILPQHTDQGIHVYIGKQRDAPALTAFFHGYPPFRRTNPAPFIPIRFITFTFPYMPSAAAQTRSHPPYRQFQTVQQIKSKV